MQISSRFTLAVHIFACIDTFGGEYKVTSDFLARKHQCQSRGGEADTGAAESLRTR